MRSKRRYELTDAQRARLEPLLPPEKPGRPNDDHRRIVNGILWVLNSVARPAAPLRRGGHGVEPVLPLAPVGRMATRAGGVAGRRRGAGRLGVGLPGQHGRARPPARRRGAQGGDEALGRSRGGFTIHVRCEGYGKPVTFALTEVHDSQRVTALIDRGAIRRIGRGRPRLRPAKLAGDKAYSSRSIRLALRKRGITPVIPTKSAASPTSTARRTASATSSSD
jgi:hypothetical protein